MTQPRIRRREREAILKSLQAGVVPRVGLSHIQVGRHDEIRSMLTDIECVADGGTMFRMISGDFGSGKSFFLSLVRSLAHENRLVTVHADLAPDRRIQATGGQARQLYAELMRNASTRSKADGGAVPSILERFITSCVTEASSSGRSVDEEIRIKLSGIQEMTQGYNFAQAVGAYWKGHHEDNEQLKQDAIKWIRGEYQTKTDARRDLGIRGIVNDSSIYDNLKLFAAFVQLAGYDGLVVSLDEFVNISKLHSKRARESNYEQLLRILNDSLQGTSEGIGFIFGITPEALMDPRRGAFSYKALETRLAENRFAGSGLVDLTGPVLRLQNLTPEDLYVLLQNIRLVHASGDDNSFSIPDDGLEAFLQHCSERLGEQFFRTPRNTIKSFIDVLVLIDQNPGSTWQSIIGDIDVAEEANPDLVPLPDDDEVSSTPVMEATSQSDDDQQDSLTSFQL